MSTHTAQVTWQRGTDVFSDRKYSRRHRWRFDGGLEVPASATPTLVRPPLSDPSAVDPEEAFVAAMASCHMLFFLDLAARAGHVVDDYTDDAEGQLGPDAEGKTAFTEVRLRPRVTWAGPPPEAAALAELHHKAHEACFIARSARCPVVITPQG
jgi:organic hydroperoxide reductase OsmC/OhrA